LAARKEIHRWVHSSYGRGEDMSKKYKECLGVSFVA